MDQLLDFSKDIDTDLLDRIVSVFYSGTASSAEVSLLGSSFVQANANFNLEIRSRYCLEAGKYLFCFLSKLF